MQRSSWHFLWRFLWWVFLWMSLRGGQFCKRSLVHLQLQRFFLLIFVWRDMCKVWIVVVGGTRWDVRANKQPDPRHIAWNIIIARSTQTVVLVFHYHLLILTIIICSNQASYIISSKLLYSLIHGKVFVDCIVYFWVATLTPCICGGQALLDGLGKSSSKLKLVASLWGNDGACGASASDLGGDGEHDCWVCFWFCCANAAVACCLLEWIACKRREAKNGGMGDFLSSTILILAQSKNVVGCCHNGLIKKSSVPTS